MNYIFNKQKITELISDFYISTGTAVTLYDMSLEIVAKSPIYSEYCTLIRKKDICVCSCDRSNLIHLKEAKETKKTVFYSCHAGLMETITPIIYDDTVIAYMQTGQFRDAECVYSSAEKSANTAAIYGFDQSKLSKYYTRLPVISQEKLRAQQNLLDIIIKSFWVDGLICKSRSMVSVKIEQYITENIAEKIYIDDICENFFLSKNSLYRIFKDEFNTTVNEFILRKRLQNAKNLLETRPDLDMTQISAACGFTDYNYFIRVFRQRIGTTPFQFRKAFQHSTDTAGK